MEKFNISFQLNAFEDSHVMDVNLGGGNERKCVVIPIDENMVITDKGGVFVNLVAFPRNTPNKYNQSHFIKRHFPKQVMEQMTREQLYEMPFFGSMQPVSLPNLSEQGYQQNYQPNNHTQQYSKPQQHTPQQYAPQKPRYVEATPTYNNNNQDDVNADDLPF